MKSNKAIAFLQSAGLAAYVAVFSVVVQAAQSIVRPENLPPVLAMGLFLLAFVTSALICGAIALGYPATLFFDGRKREALETVGWTMAWCLVILVVGSAIVVLIG